MAGQPLSKPTASFLLTHSFAGILLSCVVQHNAYVPVWEQKGLRASLPLGAQRSTLLWHKRHSMVNTEGGETRGFQ